jgi:ankyrin repeat protein
MTARPLVPSFRDGEMATIGEVLERQVELLRDAHRGGDPVAAEVLRAWGTETRSADEVLAAELDDESARLAIARDHGFVDWAVARDHAGEPVDLRFEAAADAIQWGELDTLRALLDDMPELVEMRSPFPHRAMLLHHVAANGIEVERQLQSPPNAVDIMRLLLERGADPDAICTIYCEHDTTMGLLVSSCVPAAAGVQGALVEELCAHGARVNGLDDDGVPLRTAITFGYTEAAEALARCGARVDNIVFAAALGDLDGVRRFAPAGEELELALIAAAAHGRLEVAAFLLDQGPDLSFRDPTFGATALGSARHFGHADIVALIEGLDSGTTL